MFKKIKNRITILTTTHYKASVVTNEDTNYPDYHDRKYTHTNLIKGVIDDLYSKIGDDNLRHIISLDHNPDSKGSNEYLDNLIKLSEDYKNLEIITTTEGIYYSIRNLINSTNTDYYLWWEHDWKFVNKINLNEFISLMDKNKNVNYVRFNKRENVVKAADTQIWTTPHITEMDLLRTTCWSNNPYVGRKSKMKDWYKMMNETKEKFSPTIEQFLQGKMRSDIKSMGIDKASSDWGVFIYGNYNDSNMVSHLNGKNK
jgi:hypothetical protein